MSTDPLFLLSPSRSQALQTRRVDRLPRETQAKYVIKQQNICLIQFKLICMIMSSKFTRLAYTVALLYDWIIEIHIELISVL